MVAGAAEVEEEALPRAAVAVVDADEGRQVDCVCVFVRALAFEGGREKRKG